MENKKKKTSFFLKINQALWKNSSLQKFRAVYYTLDAFLLATVKKPKKTDSAKKKVLIIYNLAFGDGIMFRGAQDALRTIYPANEYEITIACQKAFADLYRDSGIYDNVLCLDYMSAAVNLKKRRALFKQLRSEYYDIVIDPVGCEACTTNIFATRATCADKKTGVLDLSLPRIQSSKRMRRRIYDEIIELPEGKTRQLLSFYNDFFSKLGNCTFTPHLAKFEKVDLPFDLPEKFFIVFPTASMAVKSWSIENFAEITRRIQEKTNMALIVCGTNHDAQTISDFLELIPEVNTVNLVGKTSLTEFIELIGCATMVITNDTSAYHIAVAKEVNTFLLCGGYTYDRYAHYDAEGIGFKTPNLICHKMDCYNCNNFCKHSGFTVFPCIENITVDDAWKQISDIIEKDDIVYES